MQIIHHCLVTRFRNADNSVTEKFYGIDLIELKSEPYNDLEKRREGVIENGGDGQDFEQYKGTKRDGWTFSISHPEFTKEYNEDAAIERQRVNKEYDEAVEIAKKGKGKIAEKEIAKLEEERKNFLLGNEEVTEYTFVLMPHDENGNAYSEQHVRNIYNQVVEIKKLYSK